MIPLIDMPNHKQPQRLDQTDFITFSFNVQEKTIKNGDSKYQHSYKYHLVVTEKKRMLQFPTVTRYAYQEEFAYGYSKGV